MNVVAGNPRKNVERMLSFIQEAKDKGADVVAFNEMAVGGYFIGDEYNNESFCKELMSYNKVLKDASQDIVLIYGNIFYRDGVCTKNKDGRIRKHNSAYVYQNGRCMGIFHKSLLPCYRIFDDPRYFTSTPDVAFEEGIQREDGLIDWYMPVRVKIGRRNYNILWITRPRYVLIKV